MPALRHLPRLSGVLAIAACLLAGFFPSLARGDDAFSRDVLPILTKHCTDCHSGDEPEAGLNLTARDALLHGSTTGRILAAGKSAASLVVQLVAREGKPHMPPEGQLSEAEIKTLAGWIDQLTDADMPARESVLDGRDHWSFKPLTRPDVPAVKQTERVANPIDAFVLEKLEAAGLTLSPEADPRTLIRRAAFDLTGLPPTPEEVEDFCQSATRNPQSAFETLLDRLLASPAYGERWGRHWLDLARYADSGGFHDDIDRPHAWRYRDYVIRSFNEDKPYGQFVREQLAGDELAPDDPRMLVATAFGRNGPSNDNNMGPDKEKYRLDQLDETISATSAVFLGLTIGCARCHDHKFDPIPQTDYYRFLAIFDSTVNKDFPLDEQGQLLPLPTDSKAKIKLGVMAVTETSAKPRTTYLLYRGDVANRGPKMEPGVPVVLRDGEIDFTTSSEASTTLRRTKFAQWLTRPEHPLTWRVMANRVWQHHFGRGLVATPSNFGLSGEQPTHRELLDWLASELIGGGGRLKALHKQIMMSATYRQSSQSHVEGQAKDPGNLLLWRMNKRRLESEALRDAVLAAAGTLNAAAGGPGVKPRIPKELLVASQRNKWPVVQREGPEHWRRSVYIYVKRQLPFPMLELFDSPNTAQTCACRDESTVPTQALVLMNDEFTQDQAGYFAHRVIQEAGDSPRDQAQRALWLALSSEPSSARVNEAVEFLEQQQAMHRQGPDSEGRARRLALVDLCHVLLNCNEFMYID